MSELCVGGRSAPKPDGKVELDGGDSPACAALGTNQPWPLS